jgi:hypothetical protein
VIWALAVCLLTGAGEPESVVGTVRVSRGTIAPIVSLLGEDGTSVDVTGDLTSEVQSLQSAKVELVGLRDGKQFVVRAYHILDLGKGMRPTAIGLLVTSASGLAIADADGHTVPLSVSPKVRLRLERALGGKVWVFGDHLLSGEIKVGVFGVLREPLPKAPDAQAN